MRWSSLRPPRAQRSARRRSGALWSSLLGLLLCSLLVLATPQMSLAHARGGPAPHHWTPAQLQALQKALKQQIHVTHTGKALAPAQPRALAPLRPRASSLPAYNNIGISDPATRATADFDGSHRSYSAQALQDVGLVPGISITSQNITFLWPSVPTGQADNYLAAGQVIPVTATAGAATLGFLGASDQGSASGTAILTYTDGTTSTFTLGLTDWWSGSAQFGNEQVVHLTTINTKHGTKTGNFYLYSATTALNPSKTIQSVTLPSTVSGGQLHVFAVGVGGPAFNNVGISDNSNPGGANFDGGTANHSYSAQTLASADLAPNHPFDVDGIAYSWPDEPAGTADNYQAAGQVIPVTPVPGATTLGFLGAASNGPSGGTATLTYTDGTTSTFTLGFDDWWGASQYGNPVAATFTVINQNGGQRSGTYYLYTAETSIPAGKTLQSVTLPTSVTQGQLHVFAIGTRSTLNNLGTSNDSQPGEGNIDGFHKSFSLQALAAAGIKQGQAFTFNGVTFAWPASYGTLADNYVAAGQTLTVTPVANATTLAFLGMSTNAGSSAYNTGTATLTYTDGTTSPFTLTLTDWFSSSGQAGNLPVTTLSTVNIPGGTQAHTGTLYYTEIALQAGKTLQSVTLPATVSSGQMHIFAIGTRSAYNNIGISDDSNMAGANFDGQGNSYSEEDFTNPNVAGWNPGDTLTYEGINYVWPGVPAGQADNYAARGQVVAITPVANATTLGLVGAASNGGSTGLSGTATLTYTDNSTQTFTLGMTDWTLDLGAGTPLGGNRLFAVLPHQNTPQGQQTTPTYLFEMETPLLAGKTLRSITLPNQADLHVFMLGTRSGENYPNNIGTSDDSDPVFANFDGAGRSYSIEALEAAGVMEGQPFTFNGVTFTWPASYSVVPDNYQAAGQVIPGAQITGPLTNAGTLAFLGAGTNGSPSGTATLTYTDGTTQPFTLTMTDWWASQAVGGDLIAASCSYINVSSGQQSQAVHLYEAEVAVQAGKTIQSVTLPATVSTGQMHIFAVGTKAATDIPGLVGSWKFDEGSGTVAHDASTNGNDGTLTGGPTWTSGISGDALSFAGNGSTVDINQSVLNTGSSYTVAAWVTLSNTSGFHTAVSQDGTNVSGFYLQYTGSAFAFSLVSSDATSGTTTRATSSFAATPNTWYYLVGVYDASSNQIKLYVNGSLVSTQTVPAAWKATGETVIGRGKWNGAAADSWAGNIDDVQLYDRALSAQEVAALYATP